MTFRVGRTVLRPAAADVRLTGDAEPDLPALGRQALNAAHAVVRNVRSLTRKNPLQVDDAEAIARHEICKPCEFYRASDDRCAHPNCGCKLRFKTRLKAEFCPARKWAPTV